MTTEISIHRCVKLRVKRYYPDINNAITLEIVTESEDGVGDVPILMFGLPLEDTDTLLKHFSDEDTTISHGKHDDIELERQLNEELEGIGVVILGPGGAAA